MENIIIRMGSELIFDEKKYISASRASELYGYSSDYIGQLCRKKILDFRRVGRAWYVNQESLIAHKSAASAAQRGRIPGLKDGEPIFDGKRYISTAKAASIVGYSPDYISQLCRKGSLECRKVGKSWFVSEESLMAHREAASSTPRGRIPIYEKNWSSQTSEGVVSVAVLPAPIVSPMSPENNSEMSYKSFHQAAVNFLDRKEQVRQASNFAKKIAGGLVVVVIVLVFVVPTVFGGTAANYLSKITGGGAQANLVSGDVVGSIKNFLVFVGDKLTRVLTTSSEDNSNDGVKNQNGFVVVPSAGTPEANAQVKEYVQNSFSDDVEVTPDESGNSGLIKPVFKNKSDQEYMYVMVPVKDENP